MVSRSDYSIPPHKEQSNPSPVAPLPDVLSSGQRRPLRFARLSYVLFSIALCRTKSRAIYPMAAAHRSPIPPKNSSPCSSQAVPFSTLWGFRFSLMPLLGWSAISSDHCTSAAQNSRTIWPVAAAHRSLILPKASALAAVKLSGFPPCGDLVPPSRSRFSDLSFLPANEYKSASAVPSFPNIVNFS